jgi:hypothetical protein
MPACVAGIAISNISSMEALPMLYGKTIQVKFVCALLALVAAGLISAAPAKAGPDLSTPKKAAHAFFKAVEAGDADAIKATSIGTDEDYAMIKNVSEMMGAMRKMQAALVKKYGDDAKAIPDLSAVMSSQVEEAEEKIDGDSATLISKSKPDDKYPPTLKKSGDAWKMDLKNMSSDPGFVKIKDTAPKAIAALNDYTKNIESGKYPTFLDAAKALNETMSKVEP